VPIAPELSAFVAARIAAYSSECPANQQWLAPYVQKLNILPLFSDWLETTGLMADGSVRKFSADGEHSEYQGLRLVEDRSLFLHTLVHGGKRYPPLLSLVPQRPDDAVSCQNCGGLGYFVSHPNAVCLCGGTGWLLADAS
jgi:hypothetical protein